MCGHYRHSMREVSVVVSDPWSFVTEHGSTFTAELRATEGDLMLLEMEGRLYVANPRGDREDARYSLTPTTEEHSRNPHWGRDLWRGQPPALLGEIHAL
jgi:hypothetical protein